MAIRMPPPSLTVAWSGYVHWSKIGSIPRGRPTCSTGQIQRALREQRLHSGPRIEDALACRMPDELVDDGTVRRYAVGQRVRAGDLHDAPVHEIRRCRCLDRVTA